MKSTAKLPANKLSTGLLPLGLVALSLLNGASAYSESLLDAPFAISNRNPFVDVYGLPVAQAARLSDSGQLRSALQLDVANSFSRNQNSAESIVIDGETLRSNLQLRYGLSDHFELGLDVPYISHDGGSLDGFIDSWHNFWGLPDGDRPSTAKDQLQYAYQRQGDTLINLGRAEQGIGDASLSLGYQLSDGPLRQWAIRSSLKLPTGEVDGLLGSDTTDLSLGLSVSDQSLSDHYQLSWHASAGVLWMEGGGLLDELRNDEVVFGSTTLSWQYSQSLTMKLQLDAHSAFYHSELTELGSDAVQLTVGGTLRLGENWSLDLALVEDIVVDTSPDIVFHVGIKAARW
jgi:hypothetical protein